MLYVKKKGAIIRAYELGTDSKMERELLREGVIKREADGTYRLRSVETREGPGEAAKSGDYFKVEERDGKLYCYPNERSWFLRNHRNIRGDEFEQLPIPREVWQKGEPLSPEMQFLIQSGWLKIKETEPERYYQAFLWNTYVSAAEDAVVVFYSVIRDPAGEICTIDFGFVDRTAFQRDYTPFMPECDEPGGAEKKLS